MEGETVNEAKSKPNLDQMAPVLDKEGGEKAIPI